MVPMVAAEYLTQVLTSSEVRRIMGLVHLGTVLVFLAAYAFHVLWNGRGAVADRPGEGESAAPRDDAIQEQVGPVRGVPFEAEPRVPCPEGQESAARIR